MSQGMTIDGPGDTVTDLFREIASCENGKSLCVAAASGGPPR